MSASMLDKLLNFKKNAYSGNTNFYCILNMGATYIIFTTKQKDKRDMSLTPSLLPYLSLLSLAFHNLTCIEYTEELVFSMG